MALITQSEFARLKRRRDMKGKIFYGLCLMAVLISLGMLGVLLFDIISDGFSRLSWNFIVRELAIDLEWPFIHIDWAGPSRNAEQAGIGVALLGSIFVVGIAGITSFVLGVATAVYLEEYAQRSKFAQIARINIANLAGVPSIVYGLLGYGIFVRLMELGPVILAGGFTLALLVLPIIIVASSEAIRAVPSSLRGRGLRARRHPLAGRAASGPAPGVPRYTHRRHPGRQPGFGRNGASDCNGRADFRAFPSRRPAEPFYRAAHPDSQLAAASSGGVSRCGGGRHHRPADTPVNDERSGRFPAQQVPKPARRIVPCWSPNSSSGPRN